MVSILMNQRVRVKNNIPRWVAIYLSQEIGSVKLSEIAKSSRDTILNSACQLSIVSPDLPRFNRFMADLWETHYSTLDTNFPDVLD